MKIANLIFALNFVSIVSFSQTTLVPVTFIIEDFDTHEEIVAALVTVRQTALTQPTLANGKVKFDNVPVGEIEYYIGKEGYQFETGRVNVSSDIKTNNFRIPISKLDDKKILITGEISDSEGHDLQDAIVEVKITDKIESTKTDASGNFSIRIAPNDKYPSENLRIEVKKDGCKLIETIEIPRTNVVYRDFKLVCKQNNMEKSENGGVGMSSLECGVQQESKNGIYIELCGCTKKKSTVFCRLRAINKNPNIESVDKTACGDRSFLVFEGQEFKIKNLQIKDKSITYPCKHYDLVYNVPIEMEAEFFVGDTKMDKISLLKFYSFSIECKFIDVSLTNK